MSIVTLQLKNGSFVTGELIEIDEVDNAITLSKPIVFHEVMSQEGPRMTPLPYGYPFFSLDLKEEREIAFKLEDIMVGPITPPEQIQKTFTEATSVVAVTTQSLIIPK